MADPIFKLPPFDVEQVMTTLAQSIDWGVDMLGLPTLWREKEARGKGVRAAILDTGASPNHPDLLGAIVDSRDFTGSGVADRQGHSCVHPDDVVYTSLCGLQPIKVMFERSQGVAHFLEDRSIVKDVSRFNIGTLSLNRDGNMVRGHVQAVHKLPYSGMVYKVKTREGPITLTPWHPVYVETSHRGPDRTVVKKLASELKVGEMIVGSSRGPDLVSDFLQIPLRAIWKCMFCGWEARGGDRRQCKGCNRVRWNSGGPKTEFIALDDDLAFLAGLVASDGHLVISQPRIEFTNNDERLSAVFDDLFSRLFDKTPSRGKIRASQPTTITQYVDHQDAHRVLQAIGIPVGNKSRTILFPELIAKSKRSVACAFIAGVIEGDGSFGKDGRCRVCTGSKKFADGLMMMCRTLGIRSFVSTLIPKSKKVFSEKDCYHVRIGASQEILQHLKVKKPAKIVKGLERRANAIVSIETEQYDGPMYDFTIEDHGNYVANGNIVSNTHCCGIFAARDNTVGVVGVAPEAEILVGKVLGDNGSGSSAGIAAGIHWAIGMQADLISMSLGSAYPEPRIEAAVRAALAANIPVICAAGNAGPNLDTVGYPARYPGVIAVGSIDRRQQISRFSSRGERVDIVAPGDQITSCWINNGYSTISGTSMATPFVAGVVALLLGVTKKAGAPIPTPAKIVDILHRTAVDLLTPGHDPHSGFGLINPAKLLTEAVPPPPPPVVRQVELAPEDLAPSGLEKIRTTFGGDVVITLRTK